MRQKALRAGCALARTEDAAARSCSARKAVKPLRSEGQGSPCGLACFLYLADILFL